MWWCVRRKPYITGGAGWCESPHISMALSQGFLLPHAGAFKYHYSCYATYSLFAVEKSHPGKVVAHQGVFTFLKQRWAHNRRFLQWEKTSTSVQHLSGFAEGQHSVQGCVLLLKWRTLELSIETLWWHEIGEKNPHKIPLSLVKWKWGEESNEFLY